MTLARKYSKYNVPKQFVEMLLLQNKSWLVRYRKIRAMSFLPSVKCGKLQMKKAFQSGKIFACTNKSEICATSTLKLIKMMLKYQVAQASSTCMFCYNRDYAILRCILHFFALCRGPKGGMAQYSHPKYAPGCACLNGHSILVTA